MLCCDACGKLYYAQPGSLLCREYAHGIHFTTSPDNSQTTRARVLMRWLQPLALLNLRLLLLPSRLNALNL